MFWLEQDFDFSFDFGGWWSWLSSLWGADTVIWGN